jgi:TolA-binding protein
MIKKIVLALIFSVALFSNPSFSQKTSYYDNPEADYRLALELFNKEKYGAAQNLFLKTIEQVDDPEAEIRVNSEYYVAICALELFHPDAEKYLTDFIYNNPTHPRQSIASFQMGNVQYRNRKYDEALTWYARVDLFDLTREQRDEFQFKNGYSHFMIDNYDRAKQFFFEIRNPQSTYYPPATYYYAHIAYAEGNYETAMIYFQRLKDDSNFGPIVPYYIAHIYFLQEKYDDLIAYAPSLLEDSSTRRAAEISRLLGEAYYHKNDFASALPHLEDYHKQTRQRTTRADHYQLGFAYYKAEEFEKAVSNFEKVTSAQDSLAQNALYHLADSYLKTNQRHAARNAFLSAHRMDFIPSISQDALFNYAKLSFELSLNPFNEAILSFQKYIDMYPNSPRRDEAYKHLIDLYLTSNNYKDALASIEAVSVKTPALRSAHQRVAYLRGVELFNNGDFTGAIDHFDISLKSPENRTIRAQALFWKGEAFYRKEQYQEAIDQHNRFLVTQGAFSLPEYNLANYTIGYSYFKQKNYPQAITAFRKYISQPTGDNNILNDVYLRAADSYFITADYEAAINFYDRSINLRARDIDYAMFQKALAQGVTGRFQNKISTLQSLLQQYPNTSYADDARYELANSYMILDDNSSALRYFAEIQSRHPNSSYVKSAMLKTGLIYYNQNQDDRALENFKNVVNKYPGSPESQEALQSIRNIYVAMDRVDEFVRFSQGLGFANITTAQQDSLTYVAAENRYMQGDCTNATKSFSNYLDNFPNGIFALNANFYKAECEFHLNEFQRALRGYEYVLERPRSKFSENAALRAAQINFRMQSFDAALRHFKTLEQIAEFRNNVLEAQVGQMRSLDKLERSEETIETARKVLDYDKTSEELKQEANLMIARASMRKNDLTMAREYFRNTNRLAQNIMSAEAKYNLALIEFRMGNYKECEELIFNYINLLASYDYWLARMFILLADNYLVQDNIFQAKHTLESVIENYDGDDLKDIARAKLRDIEAAEREADQRGTAEPLEIDFSGRN